MKQKDNQPIESDARLYFGCSTREVIKECEFKPDPKLRYNEAQIKAGIQYIKDKLC